MTLAELRTAARQRADQENSDFIQDAELTAYINSSYAELYDLLVSRFEDYYIQDPPLTFTLTSGSWTYPLPADFYKLRGLDVSVGGGDYATVHKFDFESRNQLSGVQRRVGVGRADVRYRVVGANIQILPKDQAPGTYQLWYIPRFTKLVNDTDAVTNVLDFEEYIIVDAAIKCLLKEESDVTDLRVAKEGLRQRVLAMASGRDQNEPERIVDVRSGGEDLWD